MKHFTYQRKKVRRGITAVYVVMLMPILLGITAFAIDTGWLYSRQTRAQTAADAAALGGAWQYANFHSQDADGMAKWYAAQPENGGYVVGQNGTTVTIEYPAVDRSVTPNVTRPNWYRVTVKRPEPTFFAAIFGQSFKTVMVGATGTALYETLAEININGGGTYGTAPGPVNLSVFGPDGNYNNGDCYSVKYLPDGTPNPLYTGKGYDFTIKVGDAMRAKTTAYMQIFDPDCYNTSGASVNGTKAVDEYRGSGEGTSDYRDATTTQYSLYNDNGTPYDYSDDTLVFQKSYGNQSDTDLIWNDFASIKMSTLKANANLRMNVLSTDGGSENGFDLRLSDAAALSRTRQVAGQDNFSATNGSSITAQGHIPMNFNTTGTVTITLGVIPVEAAGGQLSIRKFDTDVGSKSVVYTCTSLPGHSWPGTLSANGTFATDTISVPTNYSTAGTWKATYAAGAGDTSVWDLSFSNYGPGKPGGIKLVQ